MPTKKPPKKQTIIFSLFATVLLGFWVISSLVQLNKELTLQIWGHQATAHILDTVIEDAGKGRSYATITYEFKTKLGTDIISRDKILMPLYHSYPAVNLPITYIDGKPNINAITEPTLKQTADYLLTLLVIGGFLISLYSLISKIFPTSRIRKYFSNPRREKAVLVFFVLFSVVFLTWFILHILY